MGSDDELDSFKTEINLTAYATGLGYELDRKASSRASAAMKHPDGDKIIVGFVGGWWVYFSVHENHSGTVIDLAQRRLSLNLGQVRRELRPWLSSPPTSVPVQSYVPKLVPVERDLLAVRAAYEAAEPLEALNPYLNDARAIPRALVVSERFAGTIRTDSRQNVLFPHHDELGLCGFEIKNDGFTGFSPGGTKGLWCSATQSDDQRLVIAETAIDALSYAALRGHDRSRFASIAGQMNPRQPALLRSAIAELPHKAEIVMALDHDAGGDAIAAAIMDIYAELGRIDLRLIDDRPASPGADWNDALRARPPQPDGGGRPEPA